MYRKKKNKKNYKKRFSYLLKGLTSTQLYNFRKKYNIYSENKRKSSKVPYMTKNPHLIQLGELFFKKKHANIINTELSFQSNYKTKQNNIINFNKNKINIKNYGETKN